MIDDSVALERVLAEGDEWQAWRALRLSGEGPEEMPAIPYQHELGGFLGPTGAPSPGSTGEALCHLRVLQLHGSGAAVVAADWLLEARTPALAWLDAPDEVPGELESSAAARVWATAASVCGLLAVGRDPGPRAQDLLRGEADAQGRFTGGAYPTFAAAGAFWMAEGPTTEMSEWALRWTRESTEEWWGPWELATGLTFWAAAGIPLEHPTVDAFLDRLLTGGPSEGWSDDLGLTLRCLEVASFLGT